MVPNGKVEGRCPYAGSTVFRIFNRFFNSTLFEVDLLHIYVTKLAFCKKNGESDFRDGFTKVIHALYLI